MLNKILLPAVTAVLVALMLPSEVDAYGAAHVGYTHVGPSGVYHTGTNAVAGPRGVAANTHTTAIGGGGAYHSSAGVAAGGYHVAPTYVGGAHYGYIR